MATTSAKNAIRHGLYSRRLSKEEAELLGASPILNIDGEIAYQRALISRLGQILENNGLAPESTGVLTLDSRSTFKLLEEAMAKLLSYLRLHHALKGDLTEYRAEIERGKNIGRERMGVFDYFKPPAPEAARTPSKPRRSSKRSHGQTKKPVAGEKEGPQDG